MSFGESEKNKKGVEMDLGSDTANLDESRTEMIVI